MSLLTEVRFIELTVLVLVRVVQRVDIMYLLENADKVVRSLNKRVLVPSYGELMTVMGVTRLMMGNKIMPTDDKFALNLLSPSNIMTWNIIVFCVAPALNHIPLISRPFCTKGLQVLKFFTKC